MTIAMLVVGALLGAAIGFLNRTITRRAIARGMKNSMLWLLPVIHMAIMAAALLVMYFVCSLVKAQPLFPMAITVLGQTVSILVMNSIDRKRAGN